MIAYVGLGVAILSFVVQSYIGWGAWKSPVTAQSSENNSPKGAPDESFRKEERNNRSVATDERKGLAVPPPSEARPNRTPRQLPATQAIPPKNEDPSTRPQTGSGAGSPRPPSSPSTEIDLGEPNVFFYLGSSKPSISPAYAEGTLVVLPEGKWGYQASPGKWAPGGWPVRVLGGNLSGKGSQVALFLDDQYKTKTHNPFVSLSVASAPEDRSPWLPVTTKSGTLYTLDADRRMKELVDGSYFARGRQEPGFLKLEIRSGRVTLSGNEGKSESGKLIYRGSLIMIEIHEGAFLGFADKETKLLHLFRYSRGGGLTRPYESFNL